MAQTIFDVVVVGTGAGGGMAIKTLCQAGLKVCALNSGRRLDPATDFRNHKQSYDMKYRGFGDPRKRDKYYSIENEYTEGLWEHGIAYTTAPGTEWEWPRCHAVGGKTNFWGRSAARMGDIDFKAASRDGFDVDWPVSYQEIAPYYSRVERMIGVASTVQNRPSNPDGEYLPPMKLRCLDYILQKGCGRVGVPYLPDRLAQLTVPHEGHPAFRVGRRRRCWSERPTDRSARRTSRLPLLRQLHGRMRYRLLLLDALVLPSPGREDG